MDTSVATAIISASSAVAVAIVALVANVIWIGRAFDQLDASLSARLDRIERIVAACKEKSDGR